MGTFGTFASGQVLTAAELNTAGEYQSYTPTWTQNVAITKTVDWARYTQLNKWVYGSVKMTATGAGTGNNKILVGLPVNASSNNFLIGQMMYVDSDLSTNLSLFTQIIYESSTTMSFYPYSASGSAPNNYLVTHTIGVRSNARFGETFTAGNNATIGGITVASGDIIHIQFMYEAA